MLVQVYHGSGFLFEGFNFDSARVKNDYYGGEAYFTDDIAIAKQYAEAMFRTAKKKSNIAMKVVYRISLTFKKLFDVNENFKGKDLLRFIGTNVEQFLRDAGLLRLGTDKYDLIARVKSGEYSVDGDTLFRGISGGMSFTARAREKLKSMGYDGLRYNGGETMNFGKMKHNVYIPYNTQQIRIEDVIKI